MASLSEAQNDGIVIGLRSVSGVYPRREIDDLVKNEPDMFNLFVLAMESLQHDETKMGFFQVSGQSTAPLLDDKCKPTY